LIAVDTSALIAILADEREARAFTLFLTRAEGCEIGAPTYFELLMVACGQRNLATEAQVELLISVTNIKVVPWTQPLALIAQSAFRAFGKGRHPAKLNFGDCMSYALAKSLDCPLLYKGDDFAQTDIVSAVASV
jgi:ribonuclease VapC